MVAQLLSKIRGRSSQQSSSHTNAHTVAVAFAPNTLTSRRTGSPGLRSGPFRAVSRCCPRDYLEIKVQDHGRILVVTPIKPSIFFFVISNLRKSIHH